MSPKAKRLLALDAFCDRTGTARYDLSNPFVVKGWLYFGDTACMARIPAKNSKDTTGRKLPRAGELFQSFGKTKTWRKWPDEIRMIRDMLDCPKCKGSGALEFRKCGECKGDGEKSCSHCGCVSECGACDGSGRITFGKCVVCEGMGVTLQPHHILVGKKTIAAQYDAKLRALGEIEWQHRDKDSLYVRCGDVQIVVMCLS